MMEHRRKTADLTILFPWDLLFSLAEYRTPHSVTEYRLHRSYFGEYRLYICPRCCVTLDREFQTCCDRCCQLLDWKGYRKAKRQR